MLIADSWEPYPRTAFERIPAGGTFEVSVDLATKFRFGDEGRYTIVAVYQSTYSGAINGVWLGKLVARADLHLTK